MDTDDSHSLSWLFDGPPPDNDPSHDRAAEKLWSVYISEAEKYDKGLVESWKNNMEGMLIFAGLFSASLTAFLIESYKTLTPDPGAMTNILLIQISNQLAAIANGTTFVVPSSPPFAAPPTSFVCNIFWFISLGLSLTCALVATLLEQWARDFLHKADMRSNPAVRARIFSYLYYGLKCFNMHAVVEVVPLLLHVSLIFFFAGLVAFLIPVHLVIAIVAVILTAIVVGTYTLLTVLPLISLDCLYRTPLSGWLWSLWRSVNRSHFDPVVQAATPAPPETETMVEAIFRSATEASAHRTTRDTRALAWTVKSLSDDVELEPFIQAIPDVLWTAHRRRRVYDSHIHALIHDPDVQLLDRLHSFYRGSMRRIMTRDEKSRQQITFYKVLSAILSTYDDSSKPLPRLQKLAHIHRFSSPDLALGRYEYSAMALLGWHRFQEERNLIPTILAELQKCGQDVGAGKAPDFRPLLSLTRGDFGAMEGLATEINNYICYPASSSPPDLILKWTLDMQQFHVTSPLRNLLLYLECTAKLNSPPYLFEEIIKIIVPRQLLLSTLKDVEKCLDGIIYDHMDRFNHDPNGTGLVFLDKLVVLALRHWWPAEDAIPLPRSVVLYLRLRESARAVESFTRQFCAYGDLAWACVTPTLLIGPSLPSPYINHQLRDPLDPRDQAGTLDALWSLLYYSDEYPDEPIYPTLPMCLSILDAVGNIRSDSIASPSVVLLLKHKILLHLCRDTPNLTTEDHLLQWLHPILPAETSIRPTVEEIREALARDQFDLFRAVLAIRLEEARIVFVSEFLDACRTDLFPHRARDTLSHASGIISIAVHPAHQIRISTSVRDLFDAVKDSRFLQQVLSLFGAYAPKSGLQIVDDPWKPWLNDPAARQIIKETFMKYKAGLTSTEPQDKVLARVEEIINNLDSLHPQDQVSDNAMPPQDLAELQEPPVSNCLRSE
ncbi:hypothetical protein MVEN_00268700 [Mycena venus]|uniref:DUF6535 domain-containing protein n=1 Tax=Mycena venus TaxID=2733690 RepID=A0A8H6Z2D2_9AGAR|nr:hypothetical protein MVEN_00268700 [Mycena venus]